VVRCACVMGPLDLVGFMVEGCAVRAGLCVVVDDMSRVRAVSLILYLYNVDEDRFVVGARVRDVESQSGWLRSVGSGVEPTMQSSARVSCARLCCMNRASCGLGDCLVMWGALVEG
jgi:hypothetical protein